MRTEEKSPGGLVKEFGIRQRLRRRPRVLVIDDESAIVAVIRAALERKADVVTATNATDALRVLLRDGDFQTVLCDLDLGTASGQDLYEAIEGADPSLAKRFVFMTGRADPFTLFLSRARKVCLCKPFGLQELAAVVDGKS